MKRIIFIIIFVLLVSTINGCRLYDGEHRELYRMIRFNVLATNGVSETDKVDIEVIEEDEYGRTLFSYTINTTGTFGYERICIIAICQKSDKKLTYYYEDECFIISDTYDNISEEDIKNLKLNNDWNKLINEERLSSRPIYQDYDDYSGMLAYDIFSQGKGISEGAEAGVRFTDYDGENKTLCLVVEYDANYDDDIIIANRYYLMIFRENGSYDKDTFIVEIEDLYNYQKQLHEFKISNDWNFS